jgi:hypothetical protein
LEEAGEELVEGDGGGEIGETVGEIGGEVGTFEADGAGGRVFGAETGGGVGDGMTATGGRCGCDAGKSLVELELMDGVFMVILSCEIFWSNWHLRCLERGTPTRRHF